MKHVQHLTAQSIKLEHYMGPWIKSWDGCYLFQNYEEEEKAVHEWLWMQGTNSVIKEFLNLYEYIKRGKMHQWVLWLWWK